MLKQGLDPKFELAYAEKKREAARREEERKGSIELLFQSYVNQMGKELIKMFIARWRRRFIHLFLEKRKLAM